MLTKNGVSDMHLGRFHLAIKMLAADFNATKHTDLITKLIASVTSVAANPTSPDIATAFKSQLELCRTIFGQSSLNHTRPILHSMLESVEAQKFIGNALFNRIVDAISANQAAPALAVQELTKLQQEVTFFYQHVLAIDTSFSQLGVEYDNLQEGESEIGLLVPRDESTSTLKDLAKEFNEWHIALAQIAQLFDKSAGPLQIRNCSTTDWMIYIAATPPILAGVLLCVKGVNEILKELISTRSIIEQLVFKNLPRQHTDALLEDNDNSFNREIRSLAEKLVEEHFDEKDEGTKNEMKNGINIALKSIARKINSGTKIELRVIPPQTPVTNADSEIEEGSELSKESDPSLLLKIEKLQALSLTLDNDIDLISSGSVSNSIVALLAAPEDEVSSSSSPATNSEANSDSVE